MTPVDRSNEGVAAFRLSWLLAALMALQALFGLLAPSLYRDQGFVRATWFGNDLVTLVAAVPLLAAGLLDERRGRVRARLLWIGGLGYGVYNYAFYLLGAALNVWFPLYLATFLLSAVAFMLTLVHTRAEDVAAGFSPGTPVRLIGGYLMLVAMALTAVWLGMWAAYVFAGRPTPVEPDAFRLIAALDLSLMVPALAAGGVLLWRRRPWGYLLATLAATQGALYLIVLAVNGVRFVHQGRVEPPGELPVWGTLALLTSAAAATLLAHAGGRFPSVGR